MSDDTKRLIESALFISARAMGTDELMRLTGIAAPGFVTTALADIRAEYDARKSALEIAEADGKWLMRVRDAYAGKVRQFAQASEVGRGAMRTLGYISRHDGILKSDVVKRVGVRAYDDIAELHINGFVRLVKSGRSKKIFLTEKFRQYFREALPGAAVPVPAAGAQPAMAPPAEKKVDAEQNDLQ
jgi:chromosome segregation and condensation protein ScpB